MRVAAWLLLLALAACSQPKPPQTVAATAPSVCHADPDGAAVADRGIGGTGAPVQSAERGIGGTGIIGVITGFASVCLAGQEVALPPGTPVEIDGQAATPAALRTGNIAAVSAAGQPGALQAQSVVVRHIVVGPVQSAGTNTVVVTGQTVVTSGVPGAGLAKPGTWVSVSGLRQADGMITATRIDPAPPGRVLVRGVLRAESGQFRIDGLPVLLPRGMVPPIGVPVTAKGTLRAGILVAKTVERDSAAESPSAYFGPAISTYIVEADISVVSGGFLIGRDFVPGGSVSPGRRGFGVAMYGRRPDGALSGFGLDFMPPGAMPIGRRGFYGGFGGGGFGGFGGPQGSGIPGYGYGPEQGPQGGGRQRR